MKVGFVSLGCAKNLVDSEQIMGMLRSYNHTVVPKPEDADVFRQSIDASVAVEVKLKF